MMAKQPAAAKPGATKKLKNKHLPAKKSYWWLKSTKKIKISWPKHSRLYGNSNTSMNMNKDAKDSVSVFSADISKSEEI